MVNRIFKDERLSIVWLLIRLYVGYEWLTAGWHKLTDPAGVWVGAKAGSSLSGFFAGAIKKSVGDHPSVQGWYAALLKNVFTPIIPVMTYLVPVGEFLVGLALITGFLTLTAAFFGAFMNFNFMFAGSTSTNPQLAILAIVIMLAGANAGKYGIDGFLATRKAGGKATSVA